MGQTNPIVEFFRNIADQFTDLFHYNKTATLIVVAVSFVAGALLF